jgi:hypothetical protein
VIHAEIDKTTRRRDGPGAHIRYVRERLESEERYPSRRRDRRCVAHLYVKRRQEKPGVFVVEQQREVRGDRTDKNGGFSCVHARSLAAEWFSTIEKTKIQASQPE